MSSDRDHASPWLRNVLLLVAFLAIVVTAIFTVVLPELEGEPAPEPPRNAREQAPSQPPAEH